MKKTKRKVGITELVLRDGHQSLIATRLRTEDMLPICGELNAAGFWSLEAWGGATFDACVRFLREDPWQRLQSLRKAIPDTRLQMLLRGRNLLGYRPYADDVIDAFVARAAANGVDVFRVFDAMNDFDNMSRALAAVKQSGKHAQGTVCYTTSPVHDIKGFVNLAKQFADAGCDSVAIKDMSGIMTPQACGELVLALKKAAALPVHVHSHSTSGLAPLCMQSGADAGADVVDSVISSFSGGASHAATETMIAMLAERDDVDIGKVNNPARLAKIADYFKAVRAKYRRFESEFTGTDPNVITHHVPGGMISNLSNQLREQRALERIGEVLEEIPRVRADLGYPPLVTPTSQIVGAQAVLNILTGGRYKTVSNEVKNYLLGHYGKIPGKVNAKVRKAAVGDAPMSSAAAGKAEMERLRGEIGKLAENDEDVLTYAMFPDIGKTFLQERAAGQLSPEPLEDKKEQSGGDGGAHWSPSEFSVTLHGETYHICVTGVGQPSAKQRPLYLTIDGVPEEALIDTLREFPAADGKQAVEAAETGRRPRPSKPGDVTTAMPGTVVDVPVKVGDKVKAGDAVLVVEAMKMETEIQSPVAGTVISVLAQKGDTVTPDEVLLSIGE